ncbi:VRR-NUC domain-containing protein [Variovorax sp. Root411]|uniref:VRR-NUC domain-containing protein n=1 Tax=Variovorax sp. Root411 TaxID=1736530 RepID=UPI0006F1FCA1|nr:VRR-NUC domain-containing protein [Variovorax sp. Root411]KQW55965.1 nuclease [Variovorax sp. Root411]
MATTMQPVASTCTTIEERLEYARLPPLTTGYLTEKVLYALKVPKIVTLKLPDGSTTDTFLKQVVVSTTIRVDETIANFYWLYKAEVSFDMTPALRNEAPIPFLSSEKADGPGRRHSLNPFPPGLTSGFLRRPDVIIVRNPAMRWPGRGVVDLDGAPHADNLLRLVEIKFPGDTWGVGQERAYQLIAGGRDRMSVLDVSDCEGELGKAKARARAPAPATEQEKARLRAPVRTEQAIPQPAWYEDWIPDTSHARTEIANAIAALWDSTKQGASYLSAEANSWLHAKAPWLFAAGHWVAETGQAAWTWVDEKGQVIYRYTAAQLKAAWHAIQRQTDLTFEMLKQIDWGQVAMTVVKGLVAIVLVVAAVVVIAVLAEALAAALAALIAIVATASAATLAALAIMLGVTAVATAG